MRPRPAERSGASTPVDEPSRSSSPGAPATARSIEHQHDSTPSFRQPLVSTDFTEDDDDVPTGANHWKYTFSESWTKVDHAALVRLDGAYAGTTVVLGQEGARIGRSRDAEVRLDDEGVSRFHAAIQLGVDSYEIVDLSSRNGTVVQGRLVSREPLEHGDIIQLGPRATFRFMLMDQKQADTLRQLHESSIRDPLTGAFNRLYVDDRLRAEIAYALRHGSDVGLLLMDIDHFKRINDEFGHPAGDAALKFLAGTVMSRLRAEDVFARYGGEEFVVLLRGIDLTGAARAGERLRAVLAASSPTFEGQNLPFTVSVGCASLATCPEKTPSALVACADRRLYIAKRTGRNRVSATDPE